MEYLFQNLYGVELRGLVCVLSRLEKSVSLVTLFHDGWVADMQMRQLGNIFIWCVYTYRCCF